MISLWQKLSAIAAAAGQKLFKRGAPAPAPLPPVLSTTYEGAKRRIGPSYIPTTFQPARFDISSASRIGLQRKSRYFERENPIFNRLVDLFECYTVGTGLVCAPATSDAEFNEIAGPAMERWFELCEVDSLEGAIESLIARTWFVDGEVFVYKTRGPSGRRRVQIIEADAISTPPDRIRDEGVSIVDGVSIDPETGRPLGYYLERKRTGGSVWELIPAEQMDHIFERIRPGQYRGIPFCSCVINELHDLDDLHRLELQAARDAAELSTILYNATGEVSAEDIIADGGSVISSTPEGRAVYLQESYGGRTAVFKNTEKVEQFRSERPSVVTREYWRYKTELVCTGIGIPYCMVFPESMQGTVYRGALDMASTWFKARARVVIRAKRRLYEYGLAQERYLVKELRDGPADWFAVNIRPPRAPNVDVGRNSTARLAELEMCATTLQDLWAELGEDAFVKVDDKAKMAAFIRERAAAHGVTPAEVMKGMTTTTSEPEPIEDDDEKPEGEEGEEGEKPSEKEEKEEVPA